MRLDGLPARTWYRLGGWLGIFDTLIHLRPFCWVVPKRIQSQVCDRFDQLLLGNDGEDGTPDV